MSSRTVPDRRLETIHLVRHAHAGDPEQWDGPDGSRPLSPKGRRQAERLGVFLLRTRILPDQIISSPKLRAAQTAESLAAVIGMHVTIDERLAEDCSLATLDALLADSGARTPLVVGHDPDFSLLLSELIGSAPQEMRKGALATIDVRRPLRPGTGSLRWLIPPGALVDPES